MRTVVFDIGGTALKYGVFDENGFLAAQFSVADEGDSLPERLCATAQTYAADRVAVSAPGPFDFESGTGQMRHKLASLYGVSLRERFAAVLPGVPVVFVHDLTAFAAGVLARWPELGGQPFACATLGTGLGYAVVSGGKVLLNDRQTPYRPLWNCPYEDGICEDYVSAAAFLREAERMGYAFDSVKALANEAENEPRLQAVFDAVGRHFGTCIRQAQARDRFAVLVIGGQIARAFGRMRAAFESVCTVPYRVVDDPSTCALRGLYAIAERGKDAFGRIMI